MEKSNQFKFNSMWFLIGVSLLALGMIYFGIQGQTPNEQFFKGLLAGIGAGLILASVFAFFARAR